MLSPKEIDKVLNKSTYVSPVDSNYLKKLEQQERKLLLQAQEKATAQEMLGEIDRLLPFCSCYTPDFSDCTCCIRENKTDFSKIFNGRPLICQDLVWQQIKQKHMGVSNG